MEPTPSDVRTGALAALTALVLILCSTFFLGPASQLRSITHGLQMPGLVFLATPTMVDGYLNALGEAGRAIYTRATWFDFGNALMLAIAGRMVIRWLATLLPSDARWPRLMIMVPVAAGLSDILENIVTLRSIGAFPALSPSLLPWITNLKLLLIFLTLLSIAGLAAIALRLRRLAPLSL